MSVILHISFRPKASFTFTLFVVGQAEAKAAGKAVKDAGLKFDIAHTSVLTRAQNTLKSILEESGQVNIPVWK